MRQIVAQQGRRLIHIHDENIDVAIVIEIPKGAAATGMRGGDSRSSRIDEFLQLAISQIAEDQPGRSIRHAGQARIGAAGHHEDIRKAIVVEIDDTRSPAHVSGLHAEADASCDDVEVPAPVIYVEIVGIVPKMGLEEIEAAVEVPIADTDTHPRLDI